MHMSDEQSDLGSANAADSGAPGVAVPNAEHTERDLRVLRDFYVSRIMTLKHVAALHFGGRTEAAKKRLQKLKAAGLVRERPRKARDPAILFLGKRGFDALYAHGCLSELPALSWPMFERRANVSALTVRHELEVMTVKAALAPAIDAQPRLRVVEFSTWPLMQEFTTRAPHMGVNVARPSMRTGAIRVKPDGLIRVLEQADDGTQHAFFLEVDRGTETLDTLALRAACYREYYMTGGYAAALGANPKAFAEYPFRVLIVFPSEERRNNVAERLLQIKPPIETHAWLSTTTEIIRDPLGPIWVRPRDYREATHDTNYAAHSQPSKPVYRRRSDREEHVRATIVRVPLFGE
jgi:hypothetical protein